MLQLFFEKTDFFTIFCSSEAHIAESLSVSPPKRVIDAESSYFVMDGSQITKKYRAKLPKIGFFAHNCRINAIILKWNPSPLRWNNNYMESS